jgi:hypothetical protein
LVEILVSYDPIYHLNTKDKQMLLASGTIRKEDLLKSLFAYKTLTAMVADNGTEFLEQPLSVIFAELDAKLAPILSTYIPKTVIDINSDSADTGTVDTELARQRAEAQANLKGTVGGVQGILSIQQSVSQGVTKRDAAISLLETIYGFDSETANRLLGDPIEIQPPLA